MATDKFALFNSKNRIVWERATRKYKKLLILIDCIECTSLEKLSAKAENEPFLKLCTAKARKNASLSKFNSELKLSLFIFGTVHDSLPICTDPVLLGFYVS